MMNYKVYKITQLSSSMIYVGMTKCGLNNRFSWHFSNARNHKNITKLIKVLNEYGKEDFKIELIESVDSKEEAFVKEAYYIQYYDAINNGFNSKESDRIPWNKGKEMSDSYCKNLSGAGNGMYGKTHTAEYKAWRSKYMSEKQLGKNNHMARKVCCVETGDIWDTATDCAKEFNVDKSAITHVCRGKHKTCKGLHFTYI